jgi:hypothetical protein
MNKNLLTTITVTIIIDVRMKGLYIASGVVAFLIITFTATIVRGTVSTDAKLKLIDDRRHQWLTEISIIDDIRQKLIAGNSSEREYYSVPHFGFGGGLVFNNSAVATKHSINTLVGTLKPF